MTSECINTFNKNEAVYSKRVFILRKSLSKKKIEGFLVTNINNVRYLTGFSGSSALLLITEEENIFVTDFRYKEQSEGEVKGWGIVIEKGDRIKLIKNLCRKNKIKKLGIESSVSYDFFKRLSDIKLEIRPLKGFIERFREKKDVAEINSIREAIRRAEVAFLEVKPYIKKGVKEISIALRLEEKLKKAGSRRIPFDIIVASGINSALPHARPTDKKLASGDLVIIDWGAEADGYFSDITRTFIIKGENISKKIHIYQTVLKANISAISKITPKMKSSEIDYYARKVINDAGYGNFFGHGTGHGLGLEIHESPRISRNNKKMITENMVFTIEPGIYIPELGGVRIEDVVTVEKDSCKILTTLPKKMEII